MKNNILVIGGTGKTGRKVVERLLQLNYDPRIGSRNAAIPFDWQDSHNWTAVLEGIDSMYVTFQPDLAIPGALEAIERLTKLAKQGGIRKMVLLSGKGEREAELCEQVVIHSGLEHTIVRASWFNQNFSESYFLDPILAGQVALPQAEAQVPYVDTDDIADVVVEVLLNGKHNGKIYELTGPRTLTFDEVIHDISKATGRDIQFTPISINAYIKTLKDAGVPSNALWLIDYLFSEVLNAKGNDEISNDIEKILARKPKDFAAYVEETAKTGVWNKVVEHQ